VLAREAVKIRFYQWEAKPDSPPSLPQPSPGLNPWSRGSGRWLEGAREQSGGCLEQSRGCSGAERRVLRTSQPRFPAAWLRSDGHRELGFACSFQKRRSPSIQTWEKLLEGLLCQTQGAAGGVRGDGALSLGAARERGSISPRSGRVRTTRSWQRHALPSLPCVP